MNNFNDVLDKADDFEDSLIRDLVKQAYKEGYKDCLRKYAIWHDGEQYVGVQQRLLRNVMNEVDNLEPPIF